MRIPADWISEYVPNELSAREMAFVLTNLGLEVEAIEGAGEATVFEIKVTPNRGDCLSVVGVARELGMRLKVRLRRREPRVRETGPAASSLVRVTLDDAKLCPRYSARVVRKVRIAPSPAWAQKRLELCGLRPINNVVDATNLVMLELGQPLHAFDYQLVRKAPGADVPEIIVRRARTGERLVTIDSEDRDLAPEILLIADPTGPIALAGIMGGSSTEIHDGTTEVLLESAHFDPRTVRRGARALGMSTEASYRFERVVDPGGTVRALDRACELIAGFCSAPVEVARGVVDAYPEPIGEREIGLRPSRVNALLGLKLKGTGIAAYLRRLGLQVQRGQPGGRLAGQSGGRQGVQPMVVRAPTFRPDLVSEIDLVEEVARAHGYEHIPETLPRESTGAGGLPPELAFEREVRHLMRGCGLSESVTSSLESPETHDRLGLPADDPRRRAVRITNWKTADRTQLRTTLLTSLLEVVAHNRRHGVADVSIFDLGRVYLPVAEGELPAEPQRLGLAVTGVMTRGRWRTPAELAAWDFHALKGVVQGLLEAMARSSGEFSLETHPSLRPGRTARVALGGETTGYLGEVRSEVREAYDLPDPVFVAELDLGVLQKQSAGEPVFAPVGRFPAVTRDIAFLLPREVPADRADRVIRESAGAEAESVRLFDAFEGMPLPEGVRNLAFSLVFRRDDRTLTDEEVEAAMGRIRTALREKLGAQIRE